MNLGDSNRRVAFWKLSGVEDDANEPVDDPWVLHKEKWAAIKGETGMGSIRAAATAGGVSTPLDRYSFRVNYDLSLTIGMQIRDRQGGRFNVIAVRHDPQDRNWTDVVGEIGGANG